MGRVRFVQLGVALALGLSGCQWFGGGEDETVVVQPVPTAAPNQPASAGPKAPSISTLIQPTNPDERLRVIRGGRVDPFAALFAGVATASDVGSSTSSSVGNSTSPNNASSSFNVVRAGGTSVNVARAGGTSVANGRNLVSLGNGGANQSSATGALGLNQSAKSSSLCGAPTGIQARTLISSSTLALPLLPAPNQARSVMVTGVVSTGDVPAAIVKASDESVARTVRTGDRLSNGNVLVKAIYAQQSEPAVVLEQYGTEVVREVGEAALPPIQATSPSTSQVVLPGSLGAFGLVRGLALNRVRLSEANSDQPLIAGTFCNNTSKIIRVARIVLQIEDKNGVVINSLPVGFSAPYILSPGQKAEFDERLKNTELGLRGRDSSQIIMRLADWS